MPSTSDASGLLPAHATAHVLLLRRVVPAPLG